MSEVTLSASVRRQLTNFVESRAPGTPYRRRALILLRAEEGHIPAAIAPEVGLPARQVRLLLRAFRRQGIDLFPEWVLRETAPFTPATEMAEAGRIALARQLAVVREHDADLRTETTATAVHETRKAIRRSRTLFKLLQPYFEPHAFRRYRRCLKRLMQRLGRARDLEVFLQKLAGYREREALAPGDAEALAALQKAWQVEKEKANEAAAHAANAPRYRQCLTAYQTFTESVGSAVRSDPPEPPVPDQVGHLAPVHIYQRLAAVRAFAGRIETISVAELHQLRIRFKELRYTLEFFAPVLGREIEAVLADLNSIQDHLGDLNDTRVALALLAERDEEPAGARLYRTAQEAEMVRLVNSFGPVWDTFDDVSWRRRLAAAVSVL